MTTLLQAILWFMGLILVAVAIVGLHRGLVSLEKRGYIYYREKPRGGGGSAFLELDRLVRPSIEHVQRADDVIVESQKNAGD